MDHYWTRFIKSCIKLVDILFRFQDIDQLTLRGRGLAGNHRNSLTISPVIINLGRYLQYVFRNRCTKAVSAQPIGGATKTCTSKPGSQNFTKFGAHALATSINQDLKWHIARGMWAWPI